MRFTDDELKGFMAIGFLVFLGVFLMVLSELF